MLCLLDLTEGDKFLVSSITAPAVIKNRLFELGLREKEIIVLKKFSYFKSSVLLRVNGFDLCLGKKIASNIYGFKV